MKTWVTVYSDLNCPFCYVLNERLRALDATGQAAWRGVQHAPGLPIPLQPCDETQARELQREVDAVRRLDPALPIAVPPGKPNTALAIQAVAFAMATDPSQGQAFKDLLYRALWREGADLSDPAVLDRVAWQAGFAHLSFGRLDQRLLTATVSRWQDDWERTGCLKVPLLMRADGQRLVGVPTVLSLAAFLRPDHSGPG